MHQFSSVAHQLFPMPERRFRVFATCHIGEPAENLLHEKELQSVEGALDRGSCARCEGESSTPTFHLINEKTLRMMRKDAYLINGSLGPVVGESALYGGEIS